MKLTVDYIFEHLDEYYTDTFETIVDHRDGHSFKNSTWNHIHGCWTLGKVHPIKKEVYAIMPFFDFDGTIKCKKVLKGFITEWYPSNDKEKFIFTSIDIAGPYNARYGKYVLFSEITKNENVFLKHFAMFDDAKEARSALKEIISSNKRETLANKANTLSREIENLKSQLSVKETEYEKIIKEIEKL